MMELTKLLTRALVRTFYEANVGFFLVVLYLAFGLMRSTEHIAIATAIATSWPLTLLTLALWAVYGFKTMGFVYRILQTKPYRILHDLAFYPSRQQWMGLSLVHFLVQAPAWVYGIFIGYFTVLYGHYVQLATLMGFLLAITLASAGLTRRLLRQPIHESQPGLWHQWISQRWALPRSLWYVRHSFVHEPLPTFLAKVGSLLILAGTFYLYTTDNYDWRLIAIGTLFAFAFNTMLVFGHYAFNLQNRWTLAIPLQKGQIIRSSLTTCVILFLPEMFVIGYNAMESASLWTMLNLCLFTVAMAFFWLGMLTRFAISREDYGKRSFYLVLVLVVILMYAVPLVVTNIVLLALGGWGMHGIYQLKTNS